MIFQDPISSLNPRRRVADIVAEPLNIWKIGTKEERREQVNAMLDPVGIDPTSTATATPGSSPGASASASASPAPWCSSPSCSSATRSSRPSTSPCRRRSSTCSRTSSAEYDLTLLFIAHDLAVVKNVSDRVAVMYLGRLCEIAPSDLLYEAPAHHYTAALLASAVEPDPEATRTSVVAARASRPAPSTRPRAAASAPAAPGPRPAAPKRSPRCGQIAPGHQVACHFPIGS